MRAYPPSPDAFALADVVQALDEIILDLRASMARELATTG